MNRELKFRAWNGMEMIYDVTVGRFGNFYVNPSNNGIDERDSASLTPFNTKYPDSVPIMQFTGLTDSEGREIYEGDILNYAGMMDTKYYVVFIDGAFQSCKEGTNEQTLIGDSMYIKVIGNIYESAPSEKQKIEK